MSVRPHISFSELGMWGLCQHRWSLDYKEGLRSTVYSRFMDFGTALHEALERYKNPKKDERVSLDEAILVFEKTFREAYAVSKPHEQEAYDNLPEPKSEYKIPLTDEQIDEWIVIGETILRNLHNLKELEDAQVLFVEHPIYIDIARTDGIETKFKGFIDIVIKTKDKRGKSVVYICDYKTCSWGWTLEKKKDENLQVQLRLYKHFFCKEFNLDPKRVRCAFILLKRVHKDKTKVADWLPISAGPKTVKRAVDKLNIAVTGMNSGNYIKNRDQCIDAYDNICVYMGTEKCPK